MKLHQANYRILSWWFDVKLSSFSFFQAFKLIVESQICWIPSVSLNQKFTMNRLEEEKKKQSLGGVLWKGVLTNFAKFTGKHLCQSLFPVNFCEISIIPFIIQHLWWLLLNFWNSFQLCYKRTPVQVFSYEFCKTSENSFSVKQSKTISSDLYCSTPWSVF